MAFCLPAPPDLPIIPSLFIKRTMSEQKLAAIQASSRKENLPEFGPGYTVSVYQKIKEGNKERLQIFKGLVIAVGSGRGVEKTFTVRKVVDGVGVEKIFPLHSPNIEKIVPEKKAKVRRAKLYFIRERSGKSARFKETYITADGVSVPVVEELEVAPEVDSSTTEAEIAVANPEEGSSEVVSAEAEKSNS